MYVLNFNKRLKIFFYMFEVVIVVFAIQVVEGDSCAWCTGVPTHDTA